jgi:GNAT acetyltransferase-like protein/acetyltransferase (GNAT) family protein
MGSIEVRQFSQLAEDHVGDCLALSAEAGWNQTSADWALFLRHGTVIGLADERSGIVATGAVLPYGDDFAWISMVLVTQSRRRERIGTSILEACCIDIAQRGLVSMLDATPAGEHVYRPLGFEGIFSLSRWQGVAEPRANNAHDIRPMRAADIGAVAAIDAAAFGADRSFLLHSLFDRLPQLAFVTEDNSGFVLARPGRIATQIGPLVAAQEERAAELLEGALGRSKGPVFLDLVDGRQMLTRRLRQRGFTVQRPFLRMGLNRALAFGDAARLFVIAGPEFG